VNDVPVRSVAGHGDAAPRASDGVGYGGRYGRLFPDLPDRDPGPEALAALVALIEQATERATENETIPAAYTYLGQFIDHDITFDPVSRLERRNDPAAIRNFRTPRFDLDSVYGTGPADQPYLYDWSGPDSGVRLLIGRSDGVADLPRNTEGRALTGDARNDEHLLISQLHLLMLQFHNRVVDELRERMPWPDRWELFDEAQRVVRWLYQWVVVHDFLERVAGRELTRTVLQPAGDDGLPVTHLRWYMRRGQPEIPVEFSAAAFRFGHSMVRAEYLLRSGGPAVPLFERPGGGDHLGGFRPLPAALAVDWSFMFSEFPSMRIDRRLSAPVLRLPPDGASLPALNLARGLALGLPCGPDVARAIGLEPLTTSELLLDEAHAPGLSPAVRDALERATPLWYYVLCEARSAFGSGGLHLGPIGGRIVAEVLVGLLRADPRSYLRQWPAWTPDRSGLPGIDEHFGMLELVRFTRGT